MGDLKNKIESVLFVVSRALTVEEISKFVGVGSVGLVKEALSELQMDYKSRDTSLEISCKFDKWNMNIKSDYLYLTEGLLTDTELTKPVQETLAVIAHKQPSLQADVIKIRGVSAYDHIKILLEEGFIISEKSGRTRLLKVTPKFYDYFNVIDSNINELNQSNEVKNEG
ncbi:SMC-Scp complex subunit ScpB [Candidatus Woesearchaeota archaeon]|nr:SMC-Scp complex subunit ScpB [Candidatus Woesearchaeota archaeon]